jgi:site-specific recombinase XerD
MMREAEASRAWSARRRAVAYRDGLMIALLAHRPIRMRNLAALTLGRHLVEEGHMWWLVIRAEETKTGRPYEAPFPEVLLPNWQRYLDTHRPVLLRGERGCMPAPTDAVWVSEVGTQLVIGALARRITQHTRAAFGASLPPHWFRDAAATTIAIEAPRHVRDAHLVLGHASLNTTERHYNQARSLEASRRHAALMARLGRSSYPDQT